MSFSIVPANGKEQMFDRASDLYNWSVKNKPQWFPERWAKQDNSPRKRKRSHFMRNQKNNESD